MKQLYRIVSGVALSSLLLFSCQPTNDEVTPSASQKTPKDYSADVVLKWGDVYLEMSRYASGYRPPVSARAMGYIGLAGYEAMVGGSKEYQSVAGYYAGLTIPKPEAGVAYQWEVAENAALLVMFKGMYPHVSDALKAKIDNTGKEQFDRLQATTDAAVFERSKKYGEAVANAVYDWSKTDTWGHDAFLRNQPTDYTPIVGVGNWQPTFPDYSKALLPYWGNVRTFVATADDKVARPPLAFNTSVTSPFYAQGLEVYAMTTQKTYETQWIGEFWSDDIYQLTFEPAARWVAIANQVITKEKAPLDKAIYTYVKVGMGLTDAGIACWNSKYIYNVMRPIDFIRRAIDPSWKTNLNNPIAKIDGVTPPFPAYPSGHSTFGAVAAEVLGEIYGYNYSMTDRCHEARTEFIGKPRAFNTFYDMAVENAVSRVYLGVHYRMDCDEGIRMGTNIGKKVNALKWKK